MLLRGTIHSQFAGIEMIDAESKAKWLESDLPKHASFATFIMSEYWSDDIKNVGLCQGGPFDGQLMCGVMKCEGVMKCSDGRSSTYLGEYLHSDDKFIWRPADACSN